MGLSAAYQNERRERIRENNAAKLGRQVDAVVRMLTIEGFITPKVAENEDPRLRRAVAAAITDQDYRPLPWAERNR